jgi:hypothetical protein
MKYVNFKTVLIPLASLFLLSCGDERISSPDSGGTDIENTDTVYNHIDTVYNHLVKYQTNYLRSLQTASGAIKDTEHYNSRICPYFANFACMALLKDTTPENTATVKKYMQWYMGKLNGSLNPVSGGVEIPGSIYDYYGDAEMTDGTYDSVDSYAATFLMLAMEFAGISEDNKTWLLPYTDKLTLVSQAMEKCIDTDYNTLPGNFSVDDDDGLSVASLAYSAKYLMDNCEVNQGLRAAQWLKENNLIAAGAGDFSTLLYNNTAAIESQLWRNTAYNWNDNGSATSFVNWSVFYPDATSQLFPGMHGVIAVSGERANRLYTQFNRIYPNWSKGEVYSGAYPWTLLAYAAASINDKARTDEYLEHIYSFNIKDEQKAYWYNSEAAFVVLAVNKIRNPGATPPYVPKNE